MDAERHEQTMRTAVHERSDSEVVAWRRVQLAQAGFPGALATRIARDGRYDLHALLELVDRGCAPVLAVRILAPLDGERAA